MIDDGYRKVPEGSVILTKEEYERLQRVENDLQQYTIELYNRARKAEAMIKEIEVEYMTNKERQESINKQYQAKKYLRGGAPWCSYCPHKIGQYGCRMKTTKSSDECLCAVAYNKSKRR